MTPSAHDSTQCLSLLHILGAARFFASHDGENSFRCAPDGKIAVTEGALYAYGVLKLGLNYADIGMNKLIGVAKELQNLSTYHIVLIIITTVFNTLEIGKSIIESEFDKHMQCLLNMVQQKLNVLVTTYNLGLMCMKMKKIVNFAAFSGGARQEEEEK